MLKHCYWGVAFFFLVGVNSALAQPGAGSQVKNEGQLVQDLSGFGWKLKRMRPGQGIREGLHELPQADIETLVDGDQVVFDLYKASMGTTVVIDKNGIVRMNEDYKDGVKLTETLQALP